MIHNLEQFGVVEVILILVLGGGLITFLLSRSGLLRRMPASGRKVAAWIAETMLIIVLLAVGLSWEVGVRHPFGLAQNTEQYAASEYRPGNFLSRPPWEIVNTRYLKPPILIALTALAGIVILSRIRMPAVLFQVMAIGTVTACGMIILQPYVVILREITSSAHELPGGAELMPSVLLPGAPIQAARLFLWALIPFLMGIYFCRHGFAWWKFVTGSLVSGLILSLVLMPVLLTINYWLILQPVVFTAIGALLLRLPQQRLAFERLFQIPLSHENAHFTARRRTGAMVLGHLLILVMLCSLGGLAVAGYVDRQQIRILVEGPKHIPRPASELNAFSILKEGGFLTEGIDGKLVFGQLPDSFKKVVLIAQGAFDDVRDKESWKKQDIGRIREGLKEIAPYIDVFTSASQCDYLQIPHRGPMLSFLPVRETARALHTRAMLAIRDKDTTAALRDIGIILEFGGMMKDYPSLVVQMISVAVTGIGSNAIYQYYKVLRHDPEAMEQLAMMLDEQRENMRVAPLNVDALRRGEPGMLEIATNVEMVVPAFVRAGMNVNGRHMQLQQLTIATALERWHAKYGRYPERLEQLVPEFLRRVPLDPYKGEPYAYQVINGDFSLKLEGVNTENSEGPLEFPPPPVVPAKSETRK